MLAKEALNSKHLLVVHLDEPGLGSARHFVVAEEHREGLGAALVLLLRFLNFVLAEQVSSR